MKTQKLLFLLVPTLLAVGLGLVVLALRQPLSLPPQAELPVELTATENLSTQENPTSAPPAEPAATPFSQTRDNTPAAQTDSQGQVVVTIIPINLDNPGSTLDFEVSLNTHSVELDMDLAALATLTTDSGQIIAASDWNGGRGGHHVSGTLSFPVGTDGQSSVAGAQTITLTLANIDAPTRVFQWSLK